jgi:Amt family ammonium transporter
VALKNAIDWVLAVLLFFAVGFGLMFGTSAGGWVGTSLFGLAGIEQIDATVSFPLIFFLFQLGFAGTAATIVSGAIAGRASFFSYVLSTLAMTGLVYPLFGHWAWGNLLISENQPWLAALGFVDFAGSTVVHSLGAWFALAGAWMIGPRRGRFDAAGQVQRMDPSSTSSVALGVLLLWVGWWGFNGGSQLAFDDRVGPILLNTNLAAAAGGLAAYVHAWQFQAKRNLAAKFMGGILGGLVAITAGCNVVTPWGAIAIGAIAGVVHNVSFEWLLHRWRIDDPVGAVAVHGFCGAWGTLAVAVFGQEALLPNPRVLQLGVQTLGVVVALVWAGAIGLATFAAIRRFVGLRVSPDEELVGIDITGELTIPEPEAFEDFDASRLRALMES